MNSTDKAESKLPKEERRAAEARKATENIRHMLIAFRARLEEPLTEQGLTLPQLRLLRAVARQHDVSAAALARTCSVTPQTLQAMLTRAVQLKWIVRGKSAKNERIVTTALTPLGEQRLRLGMDMVADLEERVWRNVRLSDLKQMNATLEEGISALDVEHEREA